MKISLKPTEKSTGPFWLEGEGRRTDYKRYRSTKDLPKYSDIVIIGAGLTGVSTAYHLKINGVKDITILDARGISEGATGRNGGHMWPLTTLPTQDEIKRYGIENVRKRHNFQIETCKLMIDFIKKYNVQCDLEYCNAMNVAVSDEEAKEMKEYYDTMCKLGLNDDNNMSYCDEKEAKEFSNSPLAKGGVRFKYVANFWPANFNFAVADKIIELGVNIQTHTTAYKVVKDWNNNEYLVHTDRGIIRCKHVVYATNAYTAGIVHELKDTIVPHRGQVLVTSPVKLRIKGNMWLDHGYQYVIQRKDGRIVLGGARLSAENGEEGVYDDSKINENVSKSLKSFLLEAWPQLKDETWWIEYEWTGIMGFTKDDNPLIGRLRGNEWIAAGYTGYGVTKCFGAGKAIADMITRKLDPKDFVPQYDPSRFYPVSKL